MYELINGIRFKGAAFQELTSMSVFSQNQGSTVRSSLIYGENGSGKSTISRAIIKASGSESGDIEEATFIDKDNRAIELQEEEKKHIFVFNEEYIEKNVRLKEDGLDNIVLLGEQGDLEDRIRSAQEILSIAQEKAIKQRSVYAEYENRESVLSPEYYAVKIKRSLQGDDHWAGREHLISETRRTNASVRNDTYKEIIKETPKKTADQLRTEFEELYEKLQNATDETKKIREKVPQTIAVSNTSAEIENLLKKKLEHPELSERERYLLLLAESGKVQQLDEMKRTFSDNSVEQCPFCLQNVTTQYKEKLIKSIQVILNKDVEVHRAELSAAKIQPIILDLELFDALDTKIVQYVKRGVVELNKAITKCNDLLQKKSDNIYIPINNAHLHLDEMKEKIETELSRLEYKRVDYNKQFDDIEQIRKSLHMINSQLSYYDICNDYETLEKQDKKKTIEKQKLLEFEIDEKNKKENYDDLIQKKKNIKIAVDVINKSLQYVFFSKDRLHIDAEDSVYSLKSNGKKVRPADVSSGERNIIALCYFFVDIMRNLEENSCYNQACFLVVDDPVSSFDLENRIGILSFLKAQLIAIMCGNINSKILIMTHDLPTFYDMETVLGEIRKTSEIKFGKKTCIYDLLELKNRGLIKFEKQRRHEYNELLLAVYEYALGNTMEYDIVIGNIMRRTLETFTTFEYRKGMAEVSCDEKLLETMGNAVYHDYFQNLMYRLVLNGESHMEERVKAMADPTFTTNTTVDEKKKIAQDILCMIFLLNKSHIEAHLTEKYPGSMKQIDDWCHKILDDNL